MSVPRPIPRATVLVRAMTAAAAVASMSPLAARAAGPTTTDEARGISSYAHLLKMKPMAVMHAMDADKKGYVTKEEFMKFYEDLFDRMDKSHDGKITQREWMGGP